jgi:hypothetical protein
MSVKTDDKTFDSIIGTLLDAFRVDATAKVSSRLVNRADDYFFQAIASGLPFNEETAAKAVDLAVKVEMMCLPAEPAGSPEEPFDGH